MRKGISPLIAAVLLIAFTMAIAAMFAQWAPSVMQSAQSGVDNRQSDVISAASSTMKISKAEFNSSSGNYTITVQNSGSANITNYTFTVYGDNPTQKRISGTLEPKEIKTVEVSTSDSSKQKIGVEAENVPSGVTVESDQVEEDTSTGGNGGGGGSNSAPTASFTDNVSSPDTGDVIEFDGTGSSDSDGSISSYEWDWDDDSDYEGTGSTATHSYSSSGDKTVKLKVTDDSGATDTTTNTVSVQTSLTAINWDSSTEWDNAVSQTGVVHESVSNTDHNDASKVKMGYDYNSPNPSFGIYSYHPFHEDSGSTANDLTGNGYDGTITGASLNKRGILGGTSYNFVDGDEVTLSSDLPLSSDDPFSYVLWIKPDVVSPSGHINMRGYSGRRDIEIENGGVQLRGWDGSEHIVGPVSLQTDTWHFVAVTFDGSTGKVYVNGSEEASGSFTWSDGSYDDTFSSTDTSLSYNGQIAEARAYNNSLSSSEISDIHGVVANTSTLTTDTKSFSSSTKPDLQNLDYTLNGETINLTIIGSPNTASEENITQELDGSSSYTLSWSNSHADFRTKINMSTSNLTKTPTVNKIELK